MMKTLPFVCAAALALSAGCGKKEGDNKSEPSPPPAAQKAGGGPELDCDAFETKMTECLDTFAPLYAKTEHGQKAGRDMEGNVDHEKAASRFKSLWSMQGKKLCTGPTPMITPYQKRDARWKERFQACTSKEDCEEWSSCMATALGEPLK